MSTALRVPAGAKAQWVILAAAMRENAEALDRATVLARQQPLPVGSARLAASPSVPKPRAGRRHLDKDSEP